MLSLADDARGFAEAIDRALADDDDARRERRRAFAANNTWSDRCDAFDAAVRELFPPASIIIVTYNNLGLTQMCLESVFRETDYPNYEVIVVDNASHDGTPAVARRAAAGEPRLRVICNADNRGFAGGEQPGAADRPRRVPLPAEQRHGRHPRLALDADRPPANDAEGGHGRAGEQHGRQRGEDTGRLHGDRGHAALGRRLLPPPRRRDHADEDARLLLRRAVAARCYEKVGELDEQFGVGYFEDTDYCYRVRQPGYELRCARDAFVHHWQGASFRLLGDDSHAHIYRKTSSLFETKWGADSMAGAY